MTLQHQQTRRQAAPKASWLQRLWTSWLDTAVVATAAHYHAPWSGQR